MKIKLYIGADHGGFKLKEKVKEWMKEWGYDYMDCGNDHYEALDDYPDFAFAVAEKVAHDPVSCGVLVCRSAAGMVIAANKIKGIRAVSAFDAESAKHSREHNNANVLALSGDWLSEEKAKELLKVWLETAFSNDERHVRRVRKIEEYENNKINSKF